MSEHRNEKVASLLMRYAAEFVEKTSNKNSIITITDIAISDDLKTAKILFTVLPENYEEGALDFLKRQRSDFRDFVKKNWRARILPFFDFEIDKGEKNRQRIDELLNQARLQDEQVKQ